VDIMALNIDIMAWVDVSVEKTSDLDSVRAR
jgi:hypothetical protein